MIPNFSFIPTLLLWALQYLYQIMKTPTHKPKYNKRKVRMGIVGPCDWLNIPNELPNNTKDIISNLKNNLKTK